MNGCWDNCAGGCGLGQTRVELWGSAFNPTTESGGGPNREDMFEGLKGGVDLWAGLLRGEAEEFGGGMKPEGGCNAVLGGPGGNH